MQDPSQGVPNFILPHVHLVSSYRYPTLATLSVEQAVEYLLNGPRIVKDGAPVSWQYFQAPPGDGTVFLEWQPTNQRGSMYASDGYMWADPEQTYTFDSQRGYTVEILVRRSGYRPGYEQVTLHQRHRYRLVHKATPNGPMFEPNLWIVHYSQSEPQARIPTSRIPLNAEMQRLVQERRFLEGQGQLARKEFMLHDRHNWPNISFAPGGQMPHGHGQPMGMYPGNPMQPGPGFRQAQFYQQGQASAIGPSPAKRPRQMPPTQMPGGVHPGMPPAAVGMHHDSTIEDEENTAIGDLLDHLTPRDISTMRYTQHHEWMEEVFSSPYAAGTIKPLDLGLGLMGGLAQLTDGILDTPAPQSIVSGHGGAKEYEKLSVEKFKELEERVHNFIKEEEEQLEKMKAEHSKKMAALTKSKTYVEAERKLRATAFDEAQTNRGLSGAPPPPASEDASGVKAGDIVQEVEKSLGVMITPRKNVNCIDKGGLIEQSEMTVRNGNDTNAEDQFTASGEANGGLEDTPMDGEDTAAGLLDQYTSNSLVDTPGSSSLQAPPVSHADAQPQAGTASATQHQTSLAGQGQSQQDAQSGDGGLDLMEGMDLDIDMTALEDGPSEKTGDDWVMVDSNNQTAATTDNTSTADGRGKDASSTSGAPGQSNDAQQTSTSAQPQESAATSAPASAAGNTPGMFDTSDFPFDTAGDALADYTGGDDLDLGLEGDAFGDAFHGTEPRNESDHPDDATN
ncbi:hypothetical protein IWX49DRAFT_122334 [Phyllosticta citricarpa]|uniref:DUF1750-domain-containing protein n=1 Tax=Phyllosticta citricarpa TaxID=55181 RepID=A0ABR1MLL1_9PEZI